MRYTLCMVASSGAYRNASASETTIAGKMTISSKRASILGISLPPRCCVWAAGERPAACQAGEPTTLVSWCTCNLLIASGFRTCRARLVFRGALGREGVGREDAAIVGALSFDGGAGLEAAGQVTAVRHLHRCASIGDGEHVRQRRRVGVRVPENTALQAHHRPRGHSPAVQQLARRDYRGDC